MAVLDASLVGDALRWKVSTRRVMEWREHLERGDVVLGVLPPLAGAPERILDLAKIDADINGRLVTRCSDLERKESFNVLDNLVRDVHKLTRFINCDLNLILSNGRHAPMHERVPCIS